MTENKIKKLYAKAETALKALPDINTERFFGDFDYALQTRLISLARSYSKDYDAGNALRIIETLFGRQRLCGHVDSSLVLLVTALEYSVYNGAGAYTALKGGITETENRFFDRLNAKSDAPPYGSLAMNALLVYAFRLHWGIYWGKPESNRYAEAAAALKKRIFNAFYDAGSGLFRAYTGGEPNSTASAYALFSDCASDKKEALIKILISRADGIATGAKYFLYFGLHFHNFDSTYGDFQYKDFILSDVEKNIDDPSFSAAAVVMLRFCSGTLPGSKLHEKPAVSGIPDGAEFDVIIQAGQSNAQGSGRGDASEPYIPCGDVYYLEDTALPTNTFVSPHGCRQDLTSLFWSDGFSFRVSRAAEHEGSDFSLAFARRYKADGRLKAGRKLLIVRSAVGATGFLSNNWRIGDPLQVRMESMSAAALGTSRKNNLIAFLWHQGENDVMLGSSEQTYTDHFAALITSLRKKLKTPSLPFVVGDFVEEWRKTGEYGDRIPPVLRALRRSAADLPGGAFVETDGLLSNNQRLNDGDKIHFCRDALYTLGERYYAAFCEIL
ncbi:hypothetical protein FACS1894211_04070 [Clostridia bacterium]|nr:hypothetical protein FACS1894211_04070 [Clostridia bacterium]